MIYKVDDLALNDKSWGVSRGGMPIHLSKNEFLILKKLMQNKNAVLSHDDIAQTVNPDLDYGSNAVDVYICAIRRKIDRQFKNPLIHTMIRVGYKIQDKLEWKKKLQQRNKSIN